MSKVVLGIDNGVKGGMAALSWNTGLLIAASVIPVMEHNLHKEVDVKTIWEWLKEQQIDTSPERLVVVVEAAPHHCPSASAVRSLALGFGKMLGWFEAKGITVIRQDVRTWQKNLLGSVSSGLTKKLALCMAASRWPEETWLPSPRHRTPHDGMIDAALIAEHHRTGGDPGGPNKRKQRKRCRASKTTSKTGRSSR